MKILQISKIILKQRGGLLIHAEKSELSDRERGLKEKLHFALLELAGCTGEGVDGVDGC